MKRFHVHLGVDDLDASIAFYAHLFAAQPTVTKPDYAKWMLDDPRVNFAISTGHARRGVEHLGIQVEDSLELADMATRLQAADRPVLDEGATACCYAQSTKAWIADPQGVVWESFLTTGEATVYGDDPGLAALGAASAHAAAGNCCAPAVHAPVTSAKASGCCG